MYIIQTNLSDDEADKANQRIAEEIEKRGGSILQRDRLGRKRLAYSIQKQDDGAYHLMHFELPPGEIAAVRLAYRLHPRLLRFLILRKEPEEIAKLQKRTREPERPPTDKPADIAVAEQGAAGDETAKAESGPETGDDSAPEAPSEQIPDKPEAEPASADAAPEPEPDKQE